MLQLIWAFINVGAFLFFIITAIRAIKLVSEKYGFAATMILIIGALGFISGGMSKSGSSTNKTNFARLPFTFIDRDLVKDQYISEIKVKDNWISQVQINAMMGKYKDNDSLVAVEASASKTGFTAGYSWETNFIHISKIPGIGQFSYMINSTEKWSLLGVTFYTESRLYEGVFFPVKSK